MHTDEESPHAAETKEPAPEEDTESDIAARVRDVLVFEARNDRRERCFAAAMARLWGVSPSCFKGLPLSGPFRGPKKVFSDDADAESSSAAENNAVPTLYQLARKALDRAYQIRGDSLLSEVSKRYTRAEIRTPTPLDQNLKRQKIRRN